MKNKIYHGSDHATHILWTKEEYEPLLKWCAGYGYGPLSHNQALGIQKFIKRLVLKKMKEDGYIIAKREDSLNHAPIL